MLKHILINGKIESLSGIRIGGNKDSMHIGGIDSPVIKNPLTNMPYIPGSSLKGKIRFLLEHYYCLVERNSGEVPRLSVRGKENWNINKIAVVFGHLDHQTNETFPTRVAFRDSNVLGAMLNGSLNTNLDMLKDRMASDFSEAKMEVNIDRISGTVNTRSGGPRTLERIPAGTVFDFSISLRIYNPEEADEHTAILLKGLKLLQQDALGGSGSRGYGKIKFLDLTVDNTPVDLDAVTL